MRLVYRFIGCTAFALALAFLWLSPLGQSAEREFGLRTLYALRGPVPVPDEALIIGLDNRSVQWMNRYARRLGDVSPVLDGCVGDSTRQALLGAANINHIPREVHACLIELLSARKTRLIVFDINFNKERVDDARLESALEAAGNVLLFERVLSGTRTASTGGDTTLVERRRPLERFVDKAEGTMAFHVNSARGEVATGYLTTFAPFDDLLPMPVKVWSSYTGHPPEQPTRPVQPLWLYGPPRTLPTIALQDVFDDSTVADLPEDLSDRVVFIGASDPRDAGIDDHFPVPTSGRGNLLIGGVELAATGFLNLLHDRTLDRPVPSVGFVIAMLIPLAGALIVVLMSRLLLPALLLVKLGYIALAAWAFIDQQIWLPLAVPAFLSVVLLVLSALLVRYLFARALVTRLAPRQIASQLLDSTVAQRRGARSEEATVMFTDLVGSTGLAEGMGEMDYAEVMNFYYDTATDTIESRRGMVVEFMGDGILAIFPRSISGAEHAKRACEAAGELVARILSDRPRSEGALAQVDLRLRVGLNSGIVATGEIGARHRYNYKALGDVVNVASRLEQLAKQVGETKGSIVLISDTTAKGAAMPEGMTTSLGEFTVRGRVAPLEVYRLRV